jgi:phage gpG-like protein
LEIAGEVQMDRAIARFADGVSDYRPVWAVIEDDFYALVGRQFATEGTEGGTAWPELTAGYAVWKERHYPGKPILQRTGELMASLTSPNAPGAVRVEERKTLTLGTTVPHAIFHQKGTRKMAARPEIRLTEGFKRTAMAHVQGYLVQMATQGGFRTGMKPTDVGWRQAWSARKMPAGAGSWQAGWM